MINNVIEPGDYVVHKILRTLNCGVQMSVIKVRETQALIAYFGNDPSMTAKEDWFNLADLQLINKVQGGFHP